MFAPAESLPSPATLNDDEENGGEDGGWVEKGARSGESCSCAEALTCNVIAPPHAMQGFAM